jgi:hypothetical protein
MKNLNRFFLISAALTLLSFATVMSLSAADTAPHAVALIQPDGAAAEAPAAAAPKKCCYNPCIVYRSRGRCRKTCCGCNPAPPVKMVLTVPDPRKCWCGCAVDVNVCLPACCKGSPCVTSHCGLFGRGKVVYTWCCGYKVVVVFAKCNVIVTSICR